MKHLSSNEVTAVSGGDTVDIEAGPIWSNSHAQSVCPGVCGMADGEWHGQWTTTVWGHMSVCGCTICENTSCEGK